MNIPRLLALGILLTFPLGASASEPVAIVYSLTGEASVAIPKTVRRPLRLFERLPARSIVRIGRDSRLALAFANGIRYELREGARAETGTADLASRAGNVRPLPQVPPLSRLVSIAADEKPGRRIAALRVRYASFHSRISGLHPAHGTASLASATRLRFNPVSSADRYAVRIINQEGRAVFEVETQATEIFVPSGILTPGGIYLWTVEALGSSGWVAEGEATFETLDTNREGAREELRQWVQRFGIVDDLWLLAGVDQNLGLAAEARQAVRKARCSGSMPGLAVETVAPESAGHRAGFMPGDRLFSWCRVSGGESCAAQGALDTPFDWLTLQMEDVQRGGVFVEGVRGAEGMRWDLLPTVQGITVAPLLHGQPGEAYKAAREREQAGDPAAAAKEIERAAEQADAAHCAEAALWLQGQAAQLHAKARQWSEADSGYQHALTRAQTLGAIRVETHLLMGWSEAFLPRGETAQARQKLERALSLEEKHDPEGLGVAALLIRLGNAADSVEEGARLQRRAYDLALRLAPGGGAEAAPANNLAGLAFMSGDLVQAEIYAARSLAIREKLTPEGEAILPSLLLYGNTLYARGDLAGAEAAFLRARRILEKVQPGSIKLGAILHNLGMLAYHRGDEESAESLLRRELAIFEKLDPSGTLVRDSLIGLGSVALRRQQGDKAEELLRRALEIEEKVHPRSAKTTWCLEGLAEAARLQGRLREAEELLRQALAIWQEINPDSIDAGTHHLQIGILLLDQGRSEAAEAHLRQAIHIYEKNGGVLPDGHHALARLLARKGKAEEAAAAYLAAANALESRRTRLGGAQESRWLYAPSLGDLYFEAAEHQIALGRPREAWNLIERGRARGFQRLLAQRDLRFGGEVPAELDAERRNLATGYDQTQAALADWTPEQGRDKLTALQDRLRDLRLEQADVQERIRRASPRLQSLESPAPLDLAAARSVLDPGTVLLTYAVGESRSALFVLEASGVPGPGFSFYSIPVGQEDLEKEVEAFRGLLGRPETLLSALQSRGRRLYDLLIRPAAPALAKADRWLVSPDGPLHSLPFAALHAGERYLAELKPHHVIASATVYKEVQEARARPSTPALELLALGDPLYPAKSENAAGASADPQVQDALRRGLLLEPLPATRDEVQAISRLFPKTRILLGRDATEEAIKSLAPQARRLHFAGHGLLDEKFPLNSGIALTIPDPPEAGRDNGLLQAWEIFEGVRLDADLVTLSACDTALGKEMGGEGLVGLTRAFQYAGARSVLASLWGVADRSTADLMTRFYGYLKAGRSKDEALRAAQIDLIRSKSFAHPYHWAAFQLVGDWR